jgi:hypothetical protein
MANLRAADDFPAIRARVEELRREREGVEEAGGNGRQPVRLLLFRVNGDPIIISVRRVRDVAAGR